MSNLFEKFERELQRTVNKIGDESMDVDELSYTEAMAEALGVIAEGLDARLYELREEQEDEEDEG